MVVGEDVLRFKAAVELALNWRDSFITDFVLIPPHLGTGDIQSLADPGNSYSFVAKMNCLPMNARTVISLTIACLIPMAPLLRTVMPFSEILKMMLKTVIS